MRLLYKILFEVKVLHEYWLTDPDNTSVFRETTQTDRLAWLTDRYTRDQPALSEDLQFLLPPAMIKLFRDQRLVLLNSYSGFQVAVRVNESVQAGGSVTYSPVAPLAGDCNMLILMRQAAGQFGLLTNGRLQRPVQSLYYFSNEQLTGPKTAPVLSNAISARAAGYAYEQGELSDNGSAICTCYYAGATALFPTVPGNGFANENDRLIVGTEFDYTFEPSDDVTTALFSLEDPAGNIVRSVSIDGPGTLDSVTLNFDDSEYPAGPPLVTLPRARASEPILYSLDVTGNGGYTKTINLVFYDQPQDLLSTWGIIQVQVTVSNGDFNLLDTNGNLVKPVLPAPDSSNSPFPVFEVRCKSRYTFWQYVSDDPATALNAPTGDLLSFLQVSGQALTTLTPVPATYLPYFFSADPGAATPSFTYLPNPQPGAIPEVDSNRIFSTVWVPESALFPASPVSP